MTRHSHPAVLLLLTAFAAATASCGTEHGNPAVAGAYEPIAPGTTHVYQVTPSGSPSYTGTFVIVGATSTAFARRLNYSNTTIYLESTYQVAGGAELLVLTETHQADGTLSASTAYDPAAVILPANVAVGATTTTTSTVTAGATTYTTTRAATVNGVEAVTVPLGTFQALKVTTVITSSNSPNANTNVVWWAPGVGRVKIVNSSPVNPTTTWELTAFTP